MVSEASKKKAAQKKAAAAAKRGGKAAAAAAGSKRNDIRIESLSLTFHGHDLIVDSELELNYGRRYGLLGLNGCGKSTLLTSIGQRELPIPEHMDIFHLTREIEASDMSSLEAVMNCDEERLKLEDEAERLIGQVSNLTLITQSIEVEICWSGNRSNGCGYKKK
nr:ABC transporter F family member 1 [Tanacetum cinerariifolium]